MYDTPSLLHLITLSHHSYTSYTNTLPHHHLHNTSSHMKYIPLTLLRMPLITSMSSCSHRGQVRCWMGPCYPHQVPRTSRPTAQETSGWLGYCHCCESHRESRRGISGERNPSVDQAPSPLPSHHTYLFFVTITITITIIRWKPLMTRLLVLTPSAAAPVPSKTTPAPTPPTAT